MIKIYIVIRFGLTIFAGVLLSILLYQSSDVPTSTNNGAVSTSSAWMPSLDDNVHIHKFTRQSRNSKLGKGDDNILLVIMSDREHGIIPTLGSIVNHTSASVDVVLIGKHTINERVRTHFGDRINAFVSLTVFDVQKDLEQQGLQPIWTWDDWHTSINNPEWRNDNTIHPGSWDHLMTHAHELNHLRFYLPHMSIFQNKGYFYFIDDDILVKRDLEGFHDKVLSNLKSEKGLVCPCNIWVWNQECFHFQFQSHEDKIVNMPSLYGHRHVCKNAADSHCVPENYWNFIEGVLPEGGEN
jgi:hypothetical protein